MRGGVEFPPGLVEALMERVGNAKQKPAPHPPLLPEAAAARLRDSFAAFSRLHELRPGMIVREKPQARLHGDIDGDTGLRVVIEPLEEPIVWDSQSEDGPPTVRIRLDMLVGFLALGHGDKPDTFLFFLVDSRRYEPVSDEEIARIGKSAEAGADQ